MPSIRSSYTDSVNFFGKHSPKELVEKYGSPLYVYNEAMLRRRAGEVRDLVKLPSFQVCYSAKANANPHILRIIKSEGLKVDSMSPGELTLTRMSGFSKDDIVYVCNNVSGEELAQAAANSRVVSVDSLSQLDLFGRHVPGGRVMIRMNPGIGVGHHKKVITAGKETKFGINPEFFDDAKAICRQYNLKLVGINQHVGSLFMEPAAFLQACERVLDAAAEFEGLEIIDFGGGFGIPYRKYEGQPRLDMAELGQKFTALLSGWSEKNGYKGVFIIEPGRYVPAESGICLGTVTAVKNNGPTRYVCTDIGFNILPRPMLYDAFHDVEIYRDGAGPEEAGEEFAQNIVGNICESGDILATDRVLPEMTEGDILGFMDAGAYCYAMASSYNQRVRPAEVLITASGEEKLIRRRETVEDLLGLITPLD